MTLKLLKNILLHTIIVVFLTVLTQVGGLIWLLSIFVSIKLKKKKCYVFPILYLVFNLLIVPPIAKQFGREPLPTFSDTLKPINLAYPLLFRNYVKSELKGLLEISAEELRYLNIRITYLDANFPFFDDFPLLPHLSHNDGKKIDLSFMYLDDDGKPTDKKPTVSGYGFYSNSDDNQTSKACKIKGYWQYDFSRYLTFGTIANLELDKKNTKILINQLLLHSQSQKLFIEPHLKQTLGLSNESKIRFHGCQAVRHDDHIHYQIK